MAVAKTRSIAYGGILLALTLISLFLATIMPTSRLSLYALSSFPVAIIVLEFGIRKGWAFYLASSLLALLLVPDKVAIVPFAVFFALYGLVKYHIELISNIVLEYVLKLVFFNLVLIGAIVLVRDLLLSGSTLFDRFPLWIIGIAFEAIFIVYDYVYTLFIRYYNTKLKRILRI